MRPVDPVREHGLSTQASGIATPNGAMSAAFIRVAAGAGQSC
ncbi:hypothetical protein ACFQVD_09715 [Streptosporangium amethystogenes subsp. fukuiense]|uniref:Uncharacterized protein n=1 Tax=Streptosporangium amethystogenes subsp. fukuiense TaxID=698418 RepID=A0ABW2SVS2_9ACTN